MVAHKTGVLPRKVAKLVATDAGIKDSWRDKLAWMAETIGVSFQIQDDIMAVASEEYAEARGLLGEDIHEGKRTLMVIHSIASSSPWDG